MWRTLPFENCIQKVKTPFKLPKKECLEHGRYPVVSQEATLISGYHDDASHLFNVDEPVVIFGDHTQALKYIDFSFVMGADGVKILKPINDIDAKYFYYALTTLMPKGKGYARHYRLLKELNISFPPLAEQQRIVAKLDAAFAEIDRAIALVDAKEAEAKAIFERQVRRYFQENVLQADSHKLSNVSDYFNGLTYSPKDVADEGTIVLRSSNIQDGKMVYKDIVRVSKNIKEKLIVKPTDILICSRNGSKKLIGKSSMIGDCDEQMTFGTFMMIVRSEMNHYLQWFFKSSYFKEQISQGEHTAINQITRYMLDEVKVPIPSNVERARVASQLGSIDDSVRNLLLTLEAKKENLKSLKSAILAQELQPPQSEAA